MKNSKAASIIFTTIIVLSFTLIYLPVLVIFLMSFTKSYSLTTLGFSSGLTLKWYASLFTTDYGALDILYRYSANIRTLKNAIINTFGITILSTSTATILGTMFSIGINALSKKKRTMMLTLNNMPIVTPDIVTGFLLLLVFVVFETVFGLKRGFPTVLIAHIFFSIPYVVLSVLPRLSQIDPNTYEAARDLGCSRMGALVKAIIPSIMTGIISGAMFAFTMSIDDFVITMFVSGTRFHNVSTWIDNGWRRGYIPKSVYAYNVIIFLIALIVIIVNRGIQSKNRKVKL